MAKSAALIQSNSQVYRVYSRRLANPADQDIFIITANKLSAFLSDSRAYYAEAQRSVRHRHSSTHQTSLFTCGYSVFDLDS